MNGDIELFPRTNRPSIGMSIAASTIFGNNEMAIRSLKGKAIATAMEHLENLPATDQIAVGVQPAATTLSR